MATLGEAFIEVHADTKPFTRELAAKLKASIKEATSTIKPESMKIGGAIAEGVANGVDKDSGKIRASFRRVGDNIDKESKTWTRKLTQPFERLAKGNFIGTRIFGEFALALGKVTGKIFTLAKHVGRLALGFGELAGGILEAVGVGLKNLVGIGGDAARAASTLTSGFTRIGTSLVALAAEAAAAGPAVAALVLVIGALIVAVAALAAVLIVAAAPFAMVLTLALALPAALSALLAIVAPLIVAFHNFGDVLGLVFEKDPKKLSEGLKKLSPTLQGLVGILRGFSGEFKLFSDSIQKAFFDPIIKQLKPALAAIMPVLTGNLTRIASALGVMVANVLKFVSQRPFIEAMAMMMGQIAEFLEKNSGLLVQIFQGLAAAAAAALPLVLTLLGKFGEFMTEFAAWIMGAITDGRFEQWLDRGLKSLQSIWNLIKSIIGLFTELFTQTDEGGRRFLDKITAAINKFREWLKSPEGKKALENAVHLAEAFADAFGVALEVVKGVLWTVNRIADTIKWIRDHPILSSFSFGGLASLAGFSGGGVVPYDQVAVVHKGEPILDPANSVGENQKILSDAGMLGVLSGQETVVNVYIGAERLDQRVDYRIARNNQTNARALTAGSRS